MVERPDSALGIISVLHRTKIIAVGGPIGVSKLAFKTTSSNGVALSNAYTYLYSCSGNCGGIAMGSQLSAVTAYAGSDNIWYTEVDNSQSHGKKYLQISQDSTAIVDFYARVQLTVNSDYVSTSLLGADYFKWSDLWANDSQEESAMLAD